MSGGTRCYWSDLWKWRELLCFLALRDIVVGCVQKAIVIAWVAIQLPLLMTMLTFASVGRQICPVAAADRHRSYLLVLFHASSFPIAVVFLWVKALSGLQASWAFQASCASIQVDRTVPRASFLITAV